LELGLLGALGVSASLGVIFWLTRIYIDKLSTSKQHFLMNFLAIFTYNGMIWNIKHKTMNFEAKFESIFLFVTGVYNTYYILLLQNILCGDFGRGGQKGGGGRIVLLLAAYTPLQLI